MKKTILILFAFIILAHSFLSGCMMIGMHGTNGNGMGHHNNDQINRNNISVTKEYISNDFKITADFPSYTLEEDLVYSINIYTISKNVFVNKATINLVLNYSNGDNNINEDIVIRDYYIENETFYFQTKLYDEGIYKLRFVISEINDVAVEPNIEIENEVHLYNNSSVQSNNSNSLLSPIAILSGSAMILMMILKFSLF